ncbi:MAG: DedA family protein [Myxococcaceae bacterium]
MVEQLDKWMLAVGPAGVVVLAFAALIEFLFPPFPGDTLLLLGGIYAVRGQQNWVLVLLAITFGSALGAMVQYAVGARLTRRVELDPHGKWFGIKHAAMKKQMDRLRGSHVLLLLFNRFMPGIRGLVFLAVGAARLPFARAISLGIVSSLIWNLLILGAGILVGGNVEKLEKLFRHYTTAALGIIIVGVVALVARYLARRKSVPKE